MGTHLQSLKSNLQKLPKNTMGNVKQHKSKVPEGLAKKRARFAKQAAAKAEVKAVQKKNNLLKRREYVTKARKYAAEYAKEKSSILAQKRAAKSQGNFYVEDEEKLAMVIRIRGVNQISPKPKKVLQMLRIADPFIAWGYPSVETMKKLIYKRGAMKINGQRIKIAENSVVERSVGQHGVTCIEDLVHEIYTVGDNFRDVNNALFPIKLSCPRGGWNKITNHFIEGGDFGNREQYINQLAMKMN